MPLEYQSLNTQFASGPFSFPGALSCSCWVCFRLCSACDVSSLRKFIDEELRLEYGGSAQHPSGLVSRERPTSSDSRLSLHLFRFGGRASTPGTDISRLSFFHGRVSRNCASRGHRQYSRHGNSRGSKQRPSLVFDYRFSALRACIIGPLSETAPSFASSYNAISNKTSTRIRRKRAIKAITIFSRQQPRHRWPTRSAFVVE